MKSVFLYSLLFTVCTSICAQDLSNGLYVSEERNEFFIIKDDSVQFRYYNDDAFASFTLGEGVLKKKRKGKFIIQPSSSLLEKTSVLYRYPGNDGILSIRVLTRDSLPITGMQIKISQLQDKNRNVVGVTDMYGQCLWDEKLIDYFGKKEVLISAVLVGYTETEKRTLLEGGYNYIIKTCIPEIFSGGVARGNKYKIEIRQISENEISIKKTGEVKLKKLCNDYPSSCFPFDKDVKTLVNSE